MARDHSQIWDKQERVWKDKQQYLVDRIGKLDRLGTELDEAKRRVKFSGSEVDVYIVRNKIKELSLSPEEQEHWHKVGE